MKAAVLHAAERTPRYEDFPDPQPTEDEVLVRVTAASLKNLDKAIADGSHYSADAAGADTGVVCGVDGVGVLENGQRVYFGGLRAPYGTMAEKSLANRHFVFPLPDTLDDATAAALPNAALSSWLPLVWRTKLQPGETVLVLGATGASGKLAIQIAKHLGAGRVVAAGRNEAVLKTLPALGADAVISLNQPDAALKQAFIQEAAHQRFDIVLDYVWGHPAEILIDALTGHDVLADVPKPIRYVTIGEMAGATIALPSEALRSTTLELYGSGGGSVPHEVIYEAFPQVMALGAAGKLKVDTERVPLSQIEQTWRRADANGSRFVIVP